VEALLAAHPQRASTGHERLQPRAGPHQIHLRRRRLGHLLEVVQDQQGRLAAQRARQDLGQ
jgi:hypothetical protein